MKKYRYYFGWDVSQATLNYCLRNMDGSIVEQGQIANTRSELKAFFKAKLQEYDLDGHQVFCLVEHTGLFSNRLVTEAHRRGLATCLEDALKINKAYARQQDKSDPEDARIISEYAFEKAYRLKQWRCPSIAECKIKVLHRRRRRAVKGRQSFLTSLNNSLKWDEVQMEGDVNAAQRKVLESMEELIELIDKKIIEIIRADAKLNEIYERARSVPGLGPKNTVVILLETWFFEKIDSAKSCANYAGLRPVERSSGTSLNKRKRTSKKVNVALKTAFHQAAFSNMVHQEHYKEYYNRKKAEGKTHLQVLNAMRNKLCRALYAMHKNQVMYDDKIQSNVA